MMPELDPLAVGFVLGIVALVVLFVWFSTLYRYCRICGREVIETKYQDGFSERTGAPVTRTRWVCPAHGSLSEWAGMHGSDDKRYTGPEDDE